MPARMNARRLSSWGAAALMVAFWCVLAPPLIRAAWHDDFLCWFIGAKLAWSGGFQHMYDPAVQWSVQKQVLPEEPILSVFPRPPFFAALVSPLGALPYKTAFLVWLAIQVVLLVFASSGPGGNLETTPWSGAPFPGPRFLESPAARTPRSFSPSHWPVTSWPSAVKNAWRAQSGD